MLAPTAACSSGAATPIPSRSRMDPPHVRAAGGRAVPSLPPCAAPLEDVPEDARRSGFREEVRHTGFRKDMRRSRFRTDVRRSGFRKNVRHTGVRKDNLCHASTPKSPSLPPSPEAHLHVTPSAHNQHPVHTINVRRTQSTSGAHNQRPAHKTEVRRTKTKPVAHDSRTQASRPCKARRQHPQVSLLQCTSTKRRTRRARKCGMQVSNACKLGAQVWHKIQVDM
eukprot:366044-Chlamydomonas_euryale.AAC.3